MPRVPVVEEQQPLRGVAGSRFQAPDTGAGARAIGGAVQRLGNAVGQAAEVEDEILTTYATARAKALDNEFVNWERETLHGENGYYRQQNADALDARGGTQEAIDKQVGALLEKTQDHRERTMLEDVLNRRRQQAFDGIARHAQGQARNFAVTQSQARQANASDNYARYVWSDPALAAENRATLLSELAAENDLLGFNDPAVIEARRGAALSGLHEGVVEATALGDPLKAQQYLDDNFDEMDGRTASRLNAKLYPMLVDNDTDDIANMAMGLATPGEVPEVSESGEGEVYAMPVAGAISSGFGMRVHPISGQRKMHQGIDIPGPTGAPVGAALSGVVHRVVPEKDAGGFGNFIEVKHANGDITRYAHLSAVNVKKGDKVARGQRIGAVGSTGNSTGPHLHLETIRDGQRVDPKTVIGSAGPAAASEPRSTGSDLAAQLQWVEDHVATNYADRPPQYRRDMLEGAKAKIRQRHNQAEADRNAAETEQWDAALEVVANLNGGAGFTDVKQVPGYYDLPGARRIQLQNMAEANRNAAASGQAIETDWQFYAGIHQAASTNPSLLRQVDPAEARRRLGDTEYKEFLRLQNPKGGAKDAAKSLTMSDILTYTRRSLIGEGYALGDSKKGRQDAPEVNRFLQRMHAEAERFKEREGRWPTAEEVRKHGDRLLLEGTAANPDARPWQSSRRTVRAFEVPGNTPIRYEVPANVRSMIKKEFPDASPQEVLDIYLRNKGKGDW